MSKILNSFVPEKISAVTMPVGTHNVIVKQIVEVTDHDANLSGAKKENYRFKDVHDQLAVTFVRADNKPGIITHRLNTMGWTRFDELSPKQQKSYLKDGDKGYAVSKKTGERLEDPARTEQCRNILNQFLNKLTTKAGEPVIDKLIEAGRLDADLVVGTQCSITVEEQMYDGKTSNRVTKIARVTAVPVLAPVDGETQENY